MFRARAFRAVPQAIPIYFDPAKTHSYFTFEDAYLVARSNTQAWKRTFSDIILSGSDKAYYEILCTDNGWEGNSLGFGWYYASYMTQYVGQDLNTIGWLSATGAVRRNGVTLETIGEHIDSSNVICRVAVDMGALKMWLSARSYWPAGHDPATPTGGFTMTAAMNQPAISNYYAWRRFTVLGDALDFTFATPSGFSPLSSFV